MLYWFQHLEKKVGETRGGINAGLSSSHLGLRTWIPWNPMQSGRNYEGQGFDLGAKEKVRDGVVKVGKKVKSTMSDPKHADYPTWCLLLGQRHAEDGLGAYLNCLTSHIHLAWSSWVYLLSSKRLWQRMGWSTVGHQGSTTPHGNNK